MIGRVAWGALIVVISVSASVIATVAAVGLGEEPAEEEPPESAEPATAPVAMERLDRRVVFQAEVERAEAPVAATGVLSAAPTADGGRVRPGDVLLEVEGRPLIALPLPFPLWRDLEPGDRGRDVEAVQTALADVGVFDGSIDGVYGPVTEAAIVALYERCGYDPPETPPPGREDGGRGRSSSASGSSGAPAEDPRTPLPAREVQAVPAGHLQLDLGGAGVGDVLEAGGGPLLRTEEVHLVAEDDGRLAEAAETGMTVRLQAEEGDRRELIVADALGEEGGGSRLLLDGRTEGLPTGTLLAGDLVTASTGGEVMAVPASAIGVTPDGGEVVETPDGDQGMREIDVTVGFRGDELVEVRSPDLSPGDEVVVSR